VNAPTSEEIRLVRESFDRVRPIANFLASQFYHRLFELAPETRSMFRRNAAADQYRMLMTGLATLIREADRPDKFSAFAQALAIRHVSFGVTPDHYEAAARALLETLQQGIGSDFTGDVRNAWNSFCGALFAEMRHAVSAHVH
jgi:hemoglobin-like flavoprotein